MRSPWLCLTIVGFMGSGALLGTVGLVWLAANHIEAPQALVAAVSICYGSLSSFLVQPPKGSVGMPEGKTD